MLTVSSNIISKAPEHGSRIYLTFDDGPDPEFTPRLLDLLASHDARASFFVLGNAAVRHPQLLRRMLDEGHELASHSGDHSHPWSSRGSRARQQVRSGYEAILEACGHRPRFFRPPYGRLRRAMLDEASRLEMRTVLWSRSAIDWGSLGTPQGVARRLAAAEAGDIFLCHDAPMVKNHPEVTLSLLPDFLARCHTRGLIPSSLSVLAG